MYTPFDIRLKNKKDTAANFESNNPVLLDGEIAFVKCADGEIRQKVGDGETAYNQLPFSDAALRESLANHTHTLADVSDTTTKKASYLVTASSTDGVAYTATVDGITALYTGLTITIIPNLQSTSRTPTLNVNGLGAKRMVMPINGSNTSATTQPPVVYSDETTEDEISSKTAVAAKWLTANKPVTVRYDGTYWETDIVAQSASCLYGTVPIESGGTNAKTAAEACTNLSALRYVAQTLTDAQKAQARANIGLTDNNSIDVTATVGQTIIVKEVDASGKPTKWEAADYQPRTHWAEEAVILPETPLQFVDGQLEIPTQYVSITLNAGETYKIMWNGVEYSCICTETYMDGARCLIVGNFGAASGTGDTGEPFVIMATEEVVAMVALDGSTSVTLSVKGVVYTPIPEKYLENALPYYIEVTGSGTDDDPYVCNDTVENVEKQFGLGRVVYMRLKNYGQNNALLLELLFTPTIRVVENEFGFTIYFMTHLASSSVSIRLAHLLPQQDGTYQVKIRDVA